MNPNEREYMIINKDTGEIIDCRNDEKVEKIIPKNDKLKYNKDKLWLDFWY